MSLSEADGQGVGAAARAITPGWRSNAVAGAAAGLLAGAGLALLMVFDGVERLALLPAGPPVVHVVLHLLAALVIGALGGIFFRYHPRGIAAITTGGFLVGLLWWIVGPLTAGAFIDGTVPSWSLAEASNTFPALISALLTGALAGFLRFFILPRLDAVPGLRRIADAPASTPVRVLILGGGFGGVATAQKLERLALAGADITVSLVSPSNSLLFTPMLAEVAGSALQPHHISAPIRAASPRTRFYRGEVVGVDLDQREVQLSGSSVSSLPYDHLVFALGSVPNYRDLPGMAEYSFTLKTLQDAITLRDHVIAMLERADAEPNPNERARMLTFVVAGAGFAGTETIAELFDLVHNARRYYPYIQPEELRFVLVHSRDRILPEIGPELADYALTKLRRRGIEVRLETRVAGADQQAMHLAGGEEIPSYTVVWTAGNQPHPLLRELPLERSSYGSLVVEETLRVPGYQELWAVGDCAQIPDPITEGFHPPTAQHALREGKAAAGNICAVVAGQEPKPFRFRVIGILVALGHRTAVAEIRGVRFSGLLAWMMWRGIYLAKLPGLEKKVRVLIDWTIDLLFPRDIVLTTQEPDAALPTASANRADDTTEASRP